VALQRNISRILSEEAEIPSHLFFMEDVVGGISVRGKPTYRDASLPADLLQRRQQCGLVTFALPSLAG
jgi:hypothetical protein